MWAAQVACADEKVRVSSPRLVLPNPFAAPASSQEPAPVEPEAPRRRPTTYQNPFVNMSAAPPIEMPVRSGPMSRWRRPTLPSRDSGTESAILTFDPAKPTRPAWDQLPLESVMATNEALQESARVTISDSESGSTIRFAPEPLTQPISVAPPADSNLAPPADRVATSDVSIRDPFELPAKVSIGAAEPIQSASPGKELIESREGTTATGNGSALPLVISDYSESPEGWFAKAQQLAQNAVSIDDMSAIIELCQRALAEAPPAELAGPLRRLAGWAHNRCGEIQIEQGLQAEASRNFQIAISLDPNCSLAIHNRAVTLAQQNESEAALRDFNRVLELNPGLSVAYRNRAELLSSLGRFDEAVRDYTRAIDGLPETAELYRARGIAQQRLGNFDEAAADLDRALKLAPNDADTYTQRGNLSAERGEFEPAVSDLHRAIAIDPNWADAYRSLAWLHATCPDARYRDPQQAIAAAEQAAKLSPPTDCFALDALAVAHASAGNFEDAARIAEQAIASAPPDYVETLRQRLNLYQQGQPFVNQGDNSVRAASHERSTSK
ncbi:MAG TPA: tetratricopeptide repeat protein [Lacipirellulaceae bacterium]